MPENRLSKPHGGKPTVRELERKVQRLEQSVKALNFHTTSVLGAVTADKTDEEMEAFRSDYASGAFYHGGKDVKKDIRDTVERARAALAKLDKMALAEKKGTELVVRSARPERPARAAQAALAAQADEPE
jgi:hypothetical protein